jgi:SAM-dependent methyltransferase
VTPAAGCPACGGPLAHWLDAPSGEPGDPNAYELLRCDRCGSAATAGPPPGAEAYETGTYAAEPPRARGLVGALQRVVVRQPVALLRRAGLARGARVLDVGAGRGRLVAALRGAGYEATGIEPSARGVAAAVGAGVPVSPHAVHDHEDEGLDAAALWHVLEHLDDPEGALRRVRGWLRPGGLLLVDVPNVASLQARIGGSGWLHLDVPRHRIHLTPAGLRELLSRAGFEPLATRHFVWEHNPGGMWTALLTRAGMQPGLAFHWLKRTRRPVARDLPALLLAIPLAPVAVAAELVAAALGRGGTIACVARRVER